MPEVTNEQHHDYIGKGFSFPLRVNVQSNLLLSGNTHNIEESIRIILGTKLGERVYRPDFGSRLDELVFAPMNTETLLLIRLYVTEALERWEPRIILNNVYVEVASSMLTKKSDPNQGKLNIIIQYTPKNYHDSKSLVYQFALQPIS
ncbi:MULTISPECIES: GPW/gp25 family protein [unclassified Anabaena]|jgi:phage baseplate assembly protein W|uniref:GPW/gp25 family protein n=1 Tax=unclassified Anabaena TaxID=2619674 RepID=UPI001446E5FD|nr:MULTISPECIES: GPW/gp25 family protein [unclassified Anabaena]MTJ08125.1 GPW/gp25 family protein [Anabaena sp. UHCC 0204]MTJ53149.1 GPW/gp25 family protein [Anabaena sp. UHCC 0253]